MKKMSTKRIKEQKNKKVLSMLTCYDFQTARLLNDTHLDMILVGDSLGNVVLGFDNTIPVKIEHMILFGQAVRRGAKNKFLILDLPFGSYAHFEQALENAIHLFQSTQADAIKFEGAGAVELQLTERLSEIGIPVVGHIGLQPQSYKTQGGYFIQGKEKSLHDKILQQAIALEKAGAFLIVLECTTEELASDITQTLSIPTIGIGSGQKVDGQVLVINDLLKNAQHLPPSFCEPIMDLYDIKLKGIHQYLQSLNASQVQ